jgi:hypothetical protein
MAHDDWRIRVELAHEEGARGFLDRLGMGTSPAAEIEHELKDARLAATRDDDTVFVYADSQRQAEQARTVLERELGEARIEPKQVRVERWLDAEGRWDDEPPGPGYEEEVIARGYAPWEVRVELPSHEQARTLADRLEAEGYEPVRRHRYLIVGTRSREDAEELARRVHGEVEPGGELVWEAVPQNPFVVFGGLGGSGTPL